MMINDIQFIDCFRMLILHKQLYYDDAGCIDLDYNMYSNNASEGKC